ncbi:hypothetical protein E4U56_007495 [Claviceps arundinis]|uniref:Uncharacterized protein n=2 Tax=Claviceps arundinis TaxID=1623583 RepID=A0A9P7MUT1_9HYPO|nr:hypothetical protein E4U56_007495 [Claviceps arundinis]
MSLGTCCEPPQESRTDSRGGSQQVPNNMVDWLGVAQHLHLKPTHNRRLAKELMVDWLGVPSTCISSRLGMEDWRRSCKPATKTILPNSCMFFGTCCEPPRESPLSPKAQLGSDVRCSRYISGSTVHVRRESEYGEADSRIGMEDSIGVDVARQNGEDEHYGDDGDDGNDADHSNGGDRDGDNGAEEDEYPSLASANR